MSPRGRAFAAAMLCCSAALPVAAQQEAGRMQPPAAIGCARDHLTVYAGRVSSYERVTGHTRIRIETDWQTRETVKLAHAGSDDPSRWFLIEGKPFEAADWARIEQGKGRLRTGTRAAAWVCDDGRNAIVDWAPPRAP